MLSPSGSSGCRASAARSGKEHGEEHEDRKLEWGAHNGRSWLTAGPVKPAVRPMPRVEPKGRTT